MKTRGEEVSQSEDQEDEYLKQQKDIIKLVQNYREKRKPNIYKKIDHAFFNYEQLLETNYASPAKWAWLSDRKAQVNILRYQKATENQEANARNFVTMDHIDALGQKNRTAFKGMETNIQQAIQTSTYIKAELQKQIEDLDRVYQANKDIDARIGRSMDGLRVMLRRIMMSKLTRFLSIITILVIIALIVVYILKNNGSI